MKFNIEFWRCEKYLPTKRHRNLRERYVKDNTDVEIPELSEQEFPVAFVLHNYKTIYENARSYKDFNGFGDYRMISEEIRTYAGLLFLPVRVTYGAAVSLCFETLDYIPAQLTPRCPYWTSNQDFTDASIVKESDRQDRIDSIRENAKAYVIFDGKVWEACGEPMYEIATFGLGHNHGGTSMFIQFHYNSNISKNRYFTALQREEAVAYGKKVAEDRGDTKSIDSIGKRCNIEVKMPEMVKRNPQKEHGDGDQFLNAVEGIVNASGSSLEAGLFIMALCRKEMEE